MFFKNKLENTTILKNYGEMLKPQKLHELLIDYERREQ